LKYILSLFLIKYLEIIGFRGGPFCGFTESEKDKKNFLTRNTEKINEDEESCEKIDLIKIDEENYYKANIPHIASTYSALSILCLLNYLNKNRLKNLILKYHNNSELEFSSEEILGHIKKSRRMTGNVNCQNWDCENDARFFYCACAIKKYLEIYEAEDKSK